MVEYEILVYRGVNINYKVFGQTPLHLACIEGSLKMCKCLLKNAADVNKLMDICSPLRFAARFSFTAICALLVDKGAEIIG